MNKRPPLRRSAPVEQENDGIIEGRNAVTEALRAGVTIDKIFIARGETDAALGHIASAAREKGIVVVDADRRKLDGMSRTHAHQGVIAQAAVRAYASVDDILSAARERGENPLIVVCDELSDPHNLGAVIRTADAAGAHGVIIPKRRSAGLTAIVGKTSAGAVAHVPVARVPNLPALLKELKKVFLRSLGTKLGYLLVKGGLDDFRGLFDQDKIGGAPFLGIAYPVIKAHGSSNETAAMNAIRQAVEFTKSGLIDDITANMEFMTIREK